MNSQLLPREAADLLLKRRRIRRKFSAWARLYSVEPADIRMNAFSVAFGGKADMPFCIAYVGLWTDM